MKHALSDSHFMLIYSKLYATSPFNHSVLLRNISDNIKYILKIDDQIPGKDTEGHGPQYIEAYQHDGSTGSV